ncbi:MAG TPA: histidinol-phosphatase [Candidatus Dormibacteraeota bacterium]|nr:histidinol-phosphatase [Candidatus Dormibacteraeota bacterium]
MRNLALRRIQVMKPYNPPLDGRASNRGLLLDFNERTLPPGAQKTQLYPEYFDLEAKIAKYAGVEAGQTMITNGTDQAIDVIFRTFADKGDVVVIPEPSFAMYAQYARIAGNRIVSPLYPKDSLAFPLTEVLAAIDGQVKVAAVCNPNSPTGTLVPVKDIERIAKKAKNAIIYVDEAYFEFSGCSAVGLIKRYPNVIISRTFSKAFGLAGLRIGYIIADKRYIAEMLKVRGPYDVNQTACDSALAALNDVETMRAYAGEVTEWAKPLVERFFEQSGITFYPSAGNFILFKPTDPAKVLAVLRQNGILLRPQDKPNIRGTLRLTIGTMAQMNTFIKVYESAILKPRSQKYAFLDRDGTLIFEPPDDPQVDSLDKLRILDGVITGLKQLVNLDYKLILISNQDGLGMASFSAKAFELPQKAMLKTFSDAGITFEKIFICPHLASDGCNCRKPKTGLLDEFLRTADIDMENSFICGDRESDKRLAKAVGLAFVSMTANGNFYKAIKPFIRRTS